MGPKDAEKRLQDSRKRRKKPTGPPSESFTSLEYVAIRVLTAERKSQSQIAALVGLSTSTVKNIVKRDEKLHTAFVLGRDDRVERIWQAAAKHAFNARSDKQLRALELLARLEGMLDRKTGAAIQNNLLININAHTAPSAVDGRTHAALMKRIQKTRHPEAIEHEEAHTEPVFRDPVRVALGIPESRE